MRASEARSIYIMANALRQVALSEGCWLTLTVSNPKTGGRKNRLTCRAWLDGRCFCRRFGKRFHLIRWNIKNKRLLSKCSWQPGMFAKAFRLNQSADAHHKADVSHFKLMVDKKRFAMSNCTHTHTSVHYAFWKQTLNPLRESNCVAISGL